MFEDWLHAVRRNHGLEHATVSVLLSRHGASRMAARATSDGFFVISEHDPEDLTACAREALRRMQAGQRSLAVSPMCGTNLAVTGMLTAAATAAAIRRGPLSRRLPNAVVAAMIAALASPVVGRLLQRHVTTQSDVDGMQVVGTRRVIGPLKKVQTSGARG